MLSKQQQKMFEMLDENFRPVSDFYDTNARADQTAFALVDRKVAEMSFSAEGNSIRLSKEWQEMERLEKSLVNFKPEGTKYRKIEKELDFYYDLFRGV